MASENPEMDAQENTADTQVEVAVLAESTGGEGQADKAAEAVGEHAEQREIDGPEAEAAGESSAESGEQEASDEAEVHVLVVNDAPEGEGAEAEPAAELAGALTPETPSDEVSHAEAEDEIIEVMALAEEPSAEAETQAAESEETDAVAEALTNAEAEEKTSEAAEAEVLAEEVAEAEAVAAEASATEEPAEEAAVEVVEAQASEAAAAEETAASVDEAEAAAEEAAEPVADAEVVALAEAALEAREEAEFQAEEAEEAEAEAEPPTAEEAAEVEAAAPEAEALAEAATPEGEEMGAETTREPVTFVADQVVVMGPNREPRILIYRYHGRSGHSLGGPVLWEASRAARFFHYKATGGQADGRETLVRIPQEQSIVILADDGDIINVQEDVARVVFPTIAQRRTSWAAEQPDTTLDRPEASPALSFDDWA